MSAEDQSASATIRPTTQLRKDRVFSSCITLSERKKVGDQVVHLAGGHILGRESHGQHEKGRDTGPALAPGHALDIDGPGLALRVIRSVAKLLPRVERRVVRIQSDDAPIILLLLGLGDASKVAIVALILLLSEPGHCPGRGQGDRRGVFPRRPVAERPGMGCPAPRCLARHGGRAADRPAD